MNVTEFRSDHAIVRLEDYPDTRFIVYNDTDAPDPIEDYGSTDVDLFVFASSYRSTNDTPNSRIGEAFKRYYERFDSELALDITRRYAQVFHGMSEDDSLSHIITYDIRGNDWSQVFVYSDTNSGAAISYAEEWEMWVKGDVFGVVAERLIPCESDDCHGDEEAHWADVSDQGIEFDSLWGVYADDPEDAAKYYANDYL